MITECQLDLQDDIPIDRQPIIVDEASNLIIPHLNSKGTHGVLSIQQNEKLTLLCPGKGNELKEFEESQVGGKCKTNGDVEADGEILFEDNLVCKKIPDSYIEATRTNCGDTPDTFLFNIGFQVRIIPTLSLNSEESTLTVVICIWVHFSLNQNQFIL